MAESAQAHSMIPMTEDHKSKLKQNHVRIVNELEKEDQVVEFLLAKSSFDKNTADRIMCQSTPVDRKREMLDILNQRPDSAFQDFVEALLETQTKPDLFQLLKDEGTPMEPKAPFLYGAAATYCDNLRSFHKDNLDKVSTLEDKPDPNKYITLTLHSQESQQRLSEERTGFRENEMGQKSRGKTIPPEDLFKAGASPEGEEAPRSRCTRGRQDGHFGQLPEETYRRPPVGR